MIRRISFVETHSQTLDEPHGTLWNRGREDYGSQKSQDNSSKPTESINLGSQGLTRTEPPTRELALA